MFETGKSLEEAITERRVTYVDQICFDEQQKTLTLILARIWDRKVILFKKLVFLDVQDFREIFHHEESYDKDYTDMFLGMDVSRKDENSHYIITTDQRELLFYSKTAPIMEKIG